MKGGVERSKLDEEMGGRGRWHLLLPRPGKKEER